jgi:putative NADH-flavin reductase
MSTITIFGATGYAGKHIVTEALSRGHQIIAVNRTGSFPATQGVQARAGSVQDAILVTELAGQSEVIVLSVQPHGDNGETLVAALPAILTAAADNNARVAVVGGAGSLKVSPDGPQLADTPDFPAEVKPVALAHNEILDALRASDTKADWFYLSPAASFGSWAPGERTGTYRTGDDVLVVDADGKSELSGADYAIAMVDEIEKPAHHQTRFTVSY